MPQEIVDQHRNSFNLRAPTPREKLGLGATFGSRPGSEASSSAGCVGIAKVVLPCGIGRAEEIANFYRRIFKFEAILSHMTVTL